MKGDEVDAAGGLSKHSYEFAGMSWRIVQSFEDDVLKAEPALMAPVVGVEHCHDLFDRTFVFDWHHLETLLGEGIVQAYCQVALTLSDESFEGLAKSNAGDGNSPRAPAVGIVGSKEISRFQYGVYVVHWLSLPHEDDVGQLIALGQRFYLVYDVCYCEITLESLAPSHAETATHATSHLAADA